MINYENEDFKNTIIDAVNKEKLVIFVGAGLSRLCGFPSWDRLAETLIDFCTSNSNCDFDYEQNEMLKIKIKDNKELISIAKDILYNTYKSDDIYFKKIQDIFNFENITNKEYIDNKKRIVKLMNSMTNTVVTTNVDTILDNNRHIAYDKETYRTSKKENVHSKIIHIHGSVIKPNTMVFTNKEYLDRYNEHWFKNAMNEIFKNDPGTVILFVGYGLSELQVLDFIVAPEQIEAFKKKRFLLQGYFKSEEKLFEVESKYYEKYGITLISYDKDEKSFKKLIDVLDYLNNEISMKSKQTKNKLEKTIKIIHSYSSKIGDDSFLNDYKSADNNIKQYIISEIIKAENKHLMKKLINDKDFTSYIYDKNNFNQNSSGFNLIHSIIYMFLTYSKKIKTEKSVTDYICDYICYIIEVCLNNIDLFNNYAFCSIVLKLIESNKKYLCNENAISFICKYVELSAEKTDWILFLFYDNNILYDCNLKFSKKIIKIVLNCIFATNNKDYYFDDFVSKYSNLILNKFPDDIYNVCLQCLKSDINQKYSYFNLSLDNLKFIRNSENEYDMKLQYLRLMLRCLENVNDNQLLELYKKYICSVNRFYSKLAIYIANIKFSMFKLDFIEKLANLVVNRHFYGEIYSYLSDHKNEFDLREIEKIGNAIDKIVFENDFLTNTYKFDLYNIFSDMDDNYCKKMAGIIKTNFTEDDWEKYENYMAPYERGKSIWSSVSRPVNDSNNIKNKIMKLKPDEYIELFEKYGTEMSIVARNSFDEYEKEYKLIEYIFENNISDLPIKLIDAMLEYNLKDSDSKTTLDVLSRENDYFCKCKFKDKNELSFKIIRDMFYIFCDSRRKIRYEDFIIINDFIDKNINFDLLDYKLNTTKKMDINLILGNDTFLCVYLKLVCTMEIKPSNVKEFLLRNWNLEQQRIVNLCVCSTINQNISIDKEWTLSNFKKMFFKDKEIDEASLLAFSLAPSFSIEVLDELKKIGVLEYIFNSYDNNTFVSSFAAHLIYYYIKNTKKLYDFVSLVLTSKCFESAMIYLYHELGNIEYNQDDIGNLKEFLDLVINSSLYKRDYSHLIVNILHFYKEYDLRNTVVELICKLSIFGTKPYYCSRIINVMQSIEFNFKDKKKIIFSFLYNLNEHFFHTDEIINLYNYVDWNNDPMGIELMNKLGKSNPEFLLSLNGKNN